jgi:hypothetical protein
MKHERRCQDKLLNDKGKPVERQGRKAMGLTVFDNTYDRQAAELN